MRLLQRWLQHSTGLLLVASSPPTLAMVTVPTMASRPTALGQAAAPGVAPKPPVFVLAKVPAPAVSRPLVLAEAAEPEVSPRPPVLAEVPALIAAFKPPVLAEAAAPKVAPGPRINQQTRSPSLGCCATRRNAPVGASKTCKLQCWSCCCTISGRGGCAVLPHPPPSIYALTFPRGACHVRRPGGQLLYVVGRGGAPPLPSIAQMTAPCPPGPRGTGGG